MSDTRKPMARFGAEQLIPLAALGVGAVFIYLGLTKYGFWSPSKGPLPGFVPTVVATGLSAMSVLAFIFSFKESSPSWPKENWNVALAAALVIGGSLLIGMIPSIALYIVLWLRVYEKCAWKTTLLTLAVLMAIVIGAFVLWLGVQFPRGLVYDALFR